MTQTPFSLFPFFLSLMLSAVLAGCNAVPSRQAAAIVDLAADRLPAVAAEYRTELYTQEAGRGHDDSDIAEEPAVWRFWRDGDKIVIERPRFGLGELWQLDGKALIHRKLYHSDRRAVEFQEDDLKMLGNPPAWMKLSLLIDPAVLERLKAEDLEWLDGKPVREYRGTVAGATWRVTLRLDLGLPVSIEREAGGVTEHTELLSAYPLSAAPWQPTPSDAYDVIDYADFGDKEYDPFVLKVQAQMGKDHDHGHSH